MRNCGTTPSAVMAPKKDKNRDRGYGGYNGGGGGGDFSYILGAHKKMKDLRKVFRLFAAKESKDGSNSDSDGNLSSGKMARKLLSN